MRSYLYLMMCFFISGCASTHRVDNNVDRLTVGSVQKEIKKGMSAAGVASALGSPNIVTSGEEDEEVWIYDKVSSDVSYSRSHAYGTLLLIGGGRSDGRSSSSQKTLTIIIKFDKSKKVKSFKYHTSRF